MYDPTSHYMVKHALIGARKARPQLDTRSPLTLDILKSMIDTLPSCGWSDYLSLTFQAMLSLAFHAYLPLGEITSSDNNLQLSHVTFSPQGIAIDFTKFKHHVGDPITLTIPPKFSPYCPVFLLLNYLSLRGQAPGPLFINLSHTPISYKQYSSVFSTLSTRLSLKGKFTPHSPRIGAATHAATSGLPEEEIKRRGRWNSDSYKKYIRIALQNYS